MQGERGAAAPRFLLHLTYLCSGENLKIYLTNNSFLPERMVRYSA
jgi:hypothetical protein